MKDMNAIVLADIRSMASLVLENEDAARKQFLAKKGTDQFSLGRKRRKAAARGKAPSCRIGNADPVDLRG